MSGTPARDDGRPLTLSDAARYLLRRLRSWPVLAVLGVVAFGLGTMSSSLARKANPLLGSGFKFDPNAYRLELARKANPFASIWLNEGYSLGYSRGYRSARDSSTIALALDSTVVRSAETQVRFTDLEVGLAVFGSGFRARTQRATGFCPMELVCEEERDLYQDVPRRRLSLNRYLRVGTEEDFRLDDDRAYSRPHR